MEQEKLTIEQTLTRFDPDRLESIKDAFVQVGEAFTKLALKLAEAFTLVFQNISKWFCNPLRWVATSKEWHIYRYTKKRRIREKYKKRLTRRLITSIRAIGEEGWRDRK